MRLYRLKKVKVIIFVGIIITFISVCNRSSEDYTKMITSVSEEVCPEIPNIVLPIETELSGDFQDKAYMHIEQLSSFGNRYAGSEAEEHTVEYISKYFLQHGLETEIDEFSFYTFFTEDVSLLVNDVPTDCLLIIINSYERTSLRGRGVIYQSAQSTAEELKDAIVIINDTLNLYQLLNSGAAAIIILGSEEYANLKKDNELLVEVPGRKEKLTSRNIIGSIYPKNPSNKEVIISAHWDSFNGPGASDNASGVAVMLELIEHYAKQKDSLPYILRFVAFGAEELGLLGSKAYISKRKEELENCIMVFNIDLVGGDQDIIIEMNGDNTPVSKLSSEDNEMYAMKGYSGKWSFNQPFMVYGNIPEWLKEDINRSCSELGYRFIPANGIGISDHQTFLKYGVPAVNISISGNKDIHTPKDTPETINKDSLAIAGRIVASVIDKSLNR